jgi:hypothetical protein
MSRETWTLDTEPVPHVRSVKIAPPRVGTITLNCSALKENIALGDSDVRDEIRRFEDMMSYGVTLTDLEQGGNDLQVKDGQIFSVTDGVDLYERCALQGIEINEDHRSSKRIDYDLILYYETTVGGGVVSYSPIPPDGYRAYIEDGMEYHEWYYKDTEGNWVKGDDSGLGGALGTEIGYMKSPTFTRPIKRVTVYGSGCQPPAKIYCPGSIEGSLDWNYYHDVSDSNQPFEEKVFTFNPVTAPLYFILYTTEHNTEPGIYINYGCWLKWILVEFI